MIISIMNRKGGAGKTTVCVNLAAIFTEKYIKENEKTLIIDLDPQANATTYLDMYDPDKKSINDVICRGEEMQSVIRETNVKNMYIAPSYITLDGADTFLTCMPASKEFVLKKKLSPIIDEYRYIFIDCPPARNNLTVNALAASDYTILPCEATEYGLDSISAMTEFIPDICEDINSELKVAGIVFSKKDNTQVQRLYENAVRSNMEYPIFKTSIRKATVIERSLNAHEPLIVYDKNAPASKDYLAFAEEVYSIVK